MQGQARLDQRISLRSDPPITWEVTMPSGEVESFISWVEAVNFYIQLLMLREKGN